jgi:hypothetical protein
MKLLYVLAGSVFRDPALYCNNACAPYSQIVWHNLVGKEISVYGDKGPIVGVVKNFSMNSLYSPIEPVVIRLHPRVGEQSVCAYEAGRNAAIEESDKRL